MMNEIADYSQIWAVDFEFHQMPGERPTPVCLVAKDLLSGQVIRMWQDELLVRSEPPYPLASDSLFVAYFASAELGCHIALGWPMPARILDLYAEFRCLTSGLPVLYGHGLLGALVHHGLPLGGSDFAQKDRMRERISQGGAYSDNEREAVLDYCQSDVEAVARLLPAMLPKIDLPRALVRGRYMAAVARMEWTGIPMDVETLGQLRADWESIRTRLIERVDRNYGVYEGRVFKADRWDDWLKKNNIIWPRLASGALALDDETFKGVALKYPVIAPMRELRKTLSQLRPHALAVGSDGRNRYRLSPFASKTGRNQPSSSKFIFGQPAWTRSLIKPAVGSAIAYVDYSQQEFGIAAALSGDTTMQEAYLSGDPYLQFAVQAGAAPPGATAETHGAVREQFKVCSLGVQYGMSAGSLARKLGRKLESGTELLRLHRETYPAYWKWSDAAQDYAELHRKLTSVLGWSIHLTQNPNYRSIRNFPLQANGAEMLRLACCLTVERGIQVAAPIHDALLIEAPDGEIDQVVTETQRIMREAAEFVLDGFALRTDAAIIRNPDRYMDKRGEAMWRLASELMGEIDG